MANELPPLPDGMEYLRVVINVPKRPDGGYDDTLIATIRERVAEAAEHMLRRGPFPA